jgi:hypothetical protein
MKPSTKRAQYPRIADLAERAHHPFRLTFKRSCVSHTPVHTLRLEAVVIRKSAQRSTEITEEVGQYITSWNREIDFG